MCMACELLQGLDIEALSPPEGAPRYPVHLPDGLGGSALAGWLARDDSPTACRLRRCPPLRSNRHWRIDAQRDFAAAAIEDFRHAWQAKLEGRLPPDARFIVALPTPYSMLPGTSPEDFSPSLLEALERHVAAQIATLTATVPATELAVQWDVCGETRIWESRGRDLGAPRDLPERLLKSFVALSQAVPPEAEIGWHFCNRDRDGVPSAAAHDSAQVTRLAGAIIASTDREPAFVQVPVPQDRDDVDYYAPLASLSLWPSMDVYLGLVHQGDDVESAWRRLYAASSVLGRVGISPACGADPAVVRPVIEQLLQRAAGDVPVGD
jgi:hypothetical protein